jgi:hypothetical protein
MTGDPCITARAGSIQVIDVASPAPSILLLLLPPPPACRMRALLVRGGAVWQLVGLITRRSQVQILPPLPRCKSLMILELTCTARSTPTYISRRANNRFSGSSNIHVTAE